MSLLKRTARFFRISRQQNVFNNIFVVLKCITVVIKTFPVLTYYFFTGSDDKAKSLFITNVIYIQILLSATHFYWKYIDRVSKKNMEIYSHYSNN